MNLILKQFNAEHQKNCLTFNTFLMIKSLFSREEINKFNLGPNLYHIFILPTKLLYRNVPMCYANNSLPLFIDFMKTKQTNVIFPPEMTSLRFFLQ